MFLGGGEILSFRNGDSDSISKSNELMAESKLDYPSKFKFPWDLTCIILINYSPNVSSMLFV